MINVGGKIQKCSVHAVGTYLKCGPKFHDSDDYYNPIASLPMEVKYIQTS